MIRTCLICGDANSPPAQYQPEGPAHCYCIDCANENFDPEQAARLELGPDSQEFQPRFTTN